MSVYSVDGHANPPEICFIDFYFYFSYLYMSFIRIYLSACSRNDSLYVIRVNRLLYARVLYCTIFRFR